jgi:SAM-dependent methyltransferase
MINPYIGERVLEVGSGMGNYMRQLVDRELILGIDISPECVEFINNEFRDKDHVQSVECDVTSPDFLKLKSFSIDTTLSVNVLEHIEDDIGALRQISNILNDDGRLILVVPAHMALYGTMDSSLGHYRRYTIKDLEEKLEAAGFELIVQRYANPLGAFGWFINGRVLKRKTPPSEQLKVFNRLMPVVKMLDRMHLPFGISVLSVSQKV